MKRQGLVWLALAGLLLLAAPAQAMLYKNPAHGLKTGYGLGGLSWENGSRPLKSGSAEFDMNYSLLDSFVGFGVTKASVLELHFGLFGAALGNGDADAGFLFGAEYRHDLTSGDFRHGFHVGYFRSTFGLDDSSATWLEGGYGIALNLTKSLSAYFGGVASVLSGTAGLGGTEFESDIPVGGYAGIEYDGRRDARFGLEVHALHEYTVGAYVHWRF